MLADDNSGYNSTRDVVNGGNQLEEHIHDKPLRVAETERTRAPGNRQNPTQTSGDFGWLLALQRSAGNKAAASVLTDRPNPGQHQSVQRDLSVQRDPTRPSRSDLITIGNSAINAEYAGAARDGLSDFESMVGASSDFGPVAVAMAGNIIWAASCFATGGAAFLMGLAGVAGSVVAPVASGRLDQPTFHQFAAAKIDALVRNLLDQTTRVAGEVDGIATAQNLDENQTRMKLLERLLKPQYIATAAGGLPTVNRPAIAQSLSTELLIMANTYGASVLHPGGGGRFVFDYDVSNHTRETGWWPFNSQSLRPVPDWRFARRPGVGIWVPQGESAAVASLRREASLKPAEISWSKSIYLDFATSGGLDISLGPDNGIVSAEGHGVFEGFADPPPRPAARTPPPPPDKIGRAREILAIMWQSSGGAPPVVPGSELSEEIFPGRSRATR